MYLTCAHREAKLGTRGNKVYLVPLHLPLSLEDLFYAAFIMYLLGTRGNKVYLGCT
jgi:hypothetical protein